MSLNSKIIIVTGGAGLIGTEICRSIVSRGGNVSICDMNEKKGISLQNELGDSKALFIRTDISLKESLDSAINDTITRFGKCDGLVHCAYPRTADWGTKFEELSIDSITANLKNQLGGTILTAQRIIPHLELNGGSIVLLSSIQGLSAPKFNHYEGTSMSSPIEYSAIKAAVNSVARYLAKYLKNKNIRVNTVSPGGILANQPQNFLDQYRKDCINKGMLDPEDISGAVCFLLSDDSKYINGQNIVVDDGWTL